MSAEVYRDTWGVPHLRAADARELAYAQGRATAVDRAWQLEVERHRVQGTTAAFLGPDAVGWDVFARRARLADTARRCFEALDAETADWVTAYVAGVNDGLAQGAGAGRPDAPDAGAAEPSGFARTGLAPGRWEPWTPLGVWLSTHILFAGFPTKLWRERAVAVLGPDAVELFATDGPGTSGSNGWLVTGEHTATGAAIIAGDPHRFIEDPGVYQQIRLSCPEFDVVGLAVPGVPGIAHFGHTGSVAWAITNSMADYQDLYRERLRRDGTDVTALGPDGWAPASVHVETVEVAGAAPVTVEVVETDRGPVIIGGPDAADAISLRHPPRVTSALGFAALPALLRARTADDVDRAFDEWVEPVNVVQAADTQGGHLHRVAGRVPLRHPVNRVRVVPAWEAAHAWTGWAPMPREEVSGTAVMANQRGLAGPLGVEFAPPYRADRIAALLAASRSWTAPEMSAILLDTDLASARPLLGLLAELKGLTPRAEALRDRLTSWDRRMEADSTDAMAYATVRERVVRALAAHPSFADLAELPPLPDLFLPWLALTPRIAFALETILTTPMLPELDRAELVRAALEEVASEGEEFGPWGEAHRLAPWQALPVPEEWPGLAGDHDCVLSTSSVPGLTHRAARGPAARYVWDLARREDSLWVVPFGASGAPDSPHHRDQLRLWAQGELARVVTDWSELRRETVYERSTYVYEEKAPGFGTVRLRRLDPSHDADLVHSWVTQERARFWGMLDADRAYVEETYAYVDSLPTHHAFLLLLDDEPVGLFQTYEPAADPLGECYEVRPGDVGIHILVAPAPGTPRPGFTGALMKSLIDYVLSDPAHQRIVVEPDVRNVKSIERMVRSGFVLGEEVQKPEKRARLAFLERPPTPPVP
ncbi:GNAT family N-acetyltransferase [Streptomyces sp. TLI_146]|uniref:GNAT family N-acetyltransferase n=1 Tax=Streptomyces sp. TLI_146 TaxID=1938858 RepID=UPI000C701CE2|nr:GNAT family N-acetyltransferase [Streptomyces sp. TLI_146]PKV87601.1 penicillin amidase [Streptomyces sp. TLI_146]